MNVPVPVLLLARELGIGGTERQLTETAKALDRDRFSPHVGCFREGFRAEELRAAGVPVARFPVTSFRSLSALTGARALGHYVRAHGIPLVHTFDTPLNVFGVPAARFWRVPVVLSSQRAYRELSGGYRHLLRLTDRMVDGVVVNCEAIRRHLVEDERVDPGLVQLCYNGLDTREYHPGDRTEGDPLTIGVVCALRPEKGLETLLDAFAQVHAAHPATRLQFVGSGPLLATLEARARDLGIGSVCHFAPTTSAVADWLRRIDLFVLPSRSEALSNALMEAMACGCCAVASAVGGNPELVRPGETGLLFPPGDAAALARALDELLRTPALRRRFAQAGAERIRREFSLAAASLRMGEIYEQVLTRAWLTPK